MLFHFFFFFYLESDHGTDLEDTEDFQGSDSEYSESSVSSKESSIPPGSIYKFSDEDTSPKMYTDLQNMNTTVSLNENEVEENMVNFIQL